jgi:hypothetical protein
LREVPDILDVKLEENSGRERHYRIRLRKEEVGQSQIARAVMEASTGLPKAMTGVEMKAIPEEKRLAQRGW